jgi:hypothetical protein
MTHATATARALRRRHRGPTLGWELPVERTTVAPNQPDVPPMSFTWRQLEEVMFVLGLVAFGVAVFALGIACGVAMGRYLQFLRTVDWWGVT